MSLKPAYTVSSGQPGLHSENMPSPDVPLVRHVVTAVRKVVGITTD